jgi:regulator of sigma E protease
LVEQELNSESFVQAIANTQSGQSIEISRQASAAGKTAVETVTITPQPGLIPEDPERPAIGVYADSLQFSQAGFIEGIQFGVVQSISGVKEITSSFITLISSAFNGSGAENLKNLAGPVGIAQMSAQAYNIGLGSLFSFAAFLSLNLVVLNLLPIPALDGGRIIFVLIEKIKGSRISPTVAGYTNLIGFGLIILLMLFVTTQDILRIF